MRLIKFTVLLLVLVGVSLAGLRLQAQPANADGNSLPPREVTGPHGEPLIINMTPVTGSNGGVLYYNATGPHGEKYAVYAGEKGADGKVINLVPLTREAAQAAEEKHEGIPPSADNVWKGLPITNSMLVTWIVAIIIILFARSATKNMKEVPDGAQNFWEMLVEGLYNFLEEITGPELIKKSFWFFATIFIFICFTNWFGLIPGVGTIGRGHQAASGEFIVDHPLLRGGNADLNMTSAMAMIFMALWLIWALQSNGIWGFILHIFGPKGESQGAMKIAMIVIFFAVGLIELMSIAFRPISLSFRLYGNIFAGENLLEAMSNIIQHPVWARHLFASILPIPFYFMELLVGFVQAVVFMLLTAGFTAVICMHDDSHEKQHH